MKVFKRVLCAAGVLVAMTAEAFAYGGPGAAITLIGSLIGVGLAIVASLFYVIAWPLRRFFKKRKASETKAEQAAESPPAAQAAMAGEGSESAAPTAQKR